MSNGLIPRGLWAIPNLRIPSLWDDFMDETVLNTIPSGLSVSADKKHIFIDAALPGIDPKDIEVTFDKGILHIAGVAEEEEAKKKYFRKATNSFSYRIVVPGEVSPREQPEVVYKNGMVHAIFKSEHYQPRRIAIKVA